MTAIIVLIFIAFLQTSVLSFDLILIIILTRAFLRVDKSNLLLSFTLGLLTSILGNLPLGVNSAIYLILTYSMQLITTTKLVKNIYTFTVLIFVLAFLHNFLIWWWLGQSIWWVNILIETMVALPTFVILRFWEERFVVKKEIKLKVSP